MRNPERIPKLLRLIHEIWSKYPDQRFNQLLHNLQKEYDDGKYIEKAFKEEVGWGMMPVSYPDLFYVEDEKFMEFLQKKLDEYSK